MFDQAGLQPVGDEVLADELFSNVPMRVLGGEVVGTLTVANDPRHPATPEDYAFLQQVSDQIALAMESARLTAQTQSALAQSEKLFEASRTLTQATDLQELTSSTVSMLGVQEINRAIMATFNYDTEGNIESLDIIANWWNGTGHEATAIGTHYPLSVIRAMSFFVSPTPVFFNDTHTDERVDATTMKLVQSLNLRAVAVLPLLTGTRQIGALILEAEEPHNFTDNETRLFSALAPQISTVLENRRQFERAKQQAERESTLNVISQKIQSATTVEAVLQIAARELGHALGAPMTIAQLSMKDKK
jgi:transcriptional regulator with GAF, ATPase, and Fis domain